MDRARETTVKRQNARQVYATSPTVSHMIGRKAMSKTQQKTEKIASGDAVELKTLSEKAPWTTDQGDGATCRIGTNGPINDERVFTHKNM